MTHTILLVDDEEDFLDVVSEFLSDEGYHVVTATSGPQALEILSREKCDLLLSDINMPGMKGFELLQIAAERYPALKRALITAYDVRDYISLISKHNIGNIITKTTPFNFNETRTLVRNIITEEVFGLDRYIDGKVHTRTITHSNQIEAVAEQVLTTISDPYSQTKFRHGLGEILINAVYYGARRENGENKDNWKLDVALQPDEYVIVCWAQDQVKTGISVTDQKGRLNKGEVLYWLERNMVRGGDGLSIGFFDKHGKGMFISRETNDRLIINTKRGEKTEVILINYYKGLYDGHRPLWVNEF